VLVVGRCEIGDRLAATDLQHRRPGQRLQMCDLPARGPQHLDDLAVRNVSQAEGFESGSELRTRRLRRQIRESCLLNGHA
jgi:hypothetical protein